MLFESRSRAFLMATLFCATAQVTSSQTKPTTTRSKAAATSAKSTATGANRQQALLTNEAKIDQLLKKLTLEEKIAMIHATSSFNSGGVKRLGIPEMETSDGPHGVRLEHGRDWKADEGVNDSGTYLPTGNTLASTWNPALGYAFGAVLGSTSSARP